MATIAENLQRIAATAISSVEEIDCNAIDVNK